MNLEELNSEILFQYRDETMSVGKVEQSNLEKRVFKNVEHIVQLLDIYQKINKQTIQRWVNQESNDSISIISLDSSSMIKNKKDSHLNLRGGSGTLSRGQNLPVASNSSISSAQASLTRLSSAARCRSYLDVLKGNTSQAVTGNFSRPDGSWVSQSGAVTL